MQLAQQFPQNLEFTPYPETRYFENENQTITIAAPWLEIEVDLSESQLKPGSQAFWNELSHWPFGTLKSNRSSKKSAVEILSELRRHRLLEKSANSVNSVLFEKHLEKTLIDRPEQFRKSLGLMIAQNLYVTQNATSALTPALDNFPAANDLIRQFIAEETGHDFLVMKSLKSLGFSTKDFPVLHATRNIVQELRHSSRVSPLAFCAAVLAFEESAYCDEDSISPWIRKLPAYAHAASGLEEHHQINQEGEHANVAMILAERIAEAGDQDRFGAQIVLDRISREESALLQQALEWSHANP